MNKEIVIKHWVHLGIKDFFIAFCIEDDFPDFATFFAHQGLEKLCKAYLLGKKEKKYLINSREKKWDMG